MRSAIPALSLPRWLSSHARRLADCSAGASAVEFAIVAPMLISLVLAILQVALIVFATQALETIASQASRQILTLQAQNQSLTQSTFQTAVCSNIVALFNCNSLMIDVQTYSSFSSAVTSAPALNFDANGNVTNSWQFNPGNAGSIVVMRIMYQWPVFLGPLGLNLSNLSNGNRLLMATAAFKNEP
jgi:Flp pilus assembly protein TadG